MRAAEQSHAGRDVDPGGLGAGALAGRTAPSGPRSVTGSEQQQVSVQADRGELQWKTGHCVLPSLSGAESPAHLRPGFCSLGTFWAQNKVRSQEWLCYADGR